MAYTDFRR